MENIDRARKCKCKDKNKKTVVVKKRHVWRDEVMEVKARNKVSFKDALLLASQRRKEIM